MSLAAAAGLALPLLEAIGYAPGRTDRALELSLVYAALPCLLKIVSAVFLLLAPLPEITSRALPPTGDDR